MLRSPDAELSMKIVVESADRQIGHNVYLPPSTLALQALCPPQSPNAAVKRGGVELGSQDDEPVRVSDGRFQLGWVIDRQGGLLLDPHHHRGRRRFCPLPQ